MNRSVVLTRSEGVDLLELLKNLKGESTILFSTHVLPDAEELSDDVLIIRGGEIAVADRLDVLRERFEQPIIEIEFESEAIAKRWSEQFSDSVRSAPELRRNAIRYRYDSASAMREEAAMIYELIASNKAPVRRVELGQTTLEDLFLKVVGQ